MPIPKGHQDEGSGVYGSEESSALAHPLPKEALGSTGRNLQPGRAAVRVRLRGFFQGLQWNNLMEGAANPPVSSPVTASGADEQSTQEPHGAVRSGWSPGPSEIPTGAIGQHGEQQLFHPLPDFPDSEDLHLRLQG